MLNHRECNGILGVPNRYEILAAGLALTGGAVAPSFLTCLPEVHKRIQLKYKIVDSTDEKLDGFLAD